MGRNKKKEGPGRPKLDKNDRKSHAICVKVSEKEYNLLKARADYHHEPLATQLRNLVVGCVEIDVRRLIDRGEIEDIF